MAAVWVVNAPQAAGQKTGGSAGGRLPRAAELSDAEKRIISALNSERRLEGIRLLAMMAKDSPFSAEPFPYRSSELVRALIACLNDPEPTIQGAAAHMLGVIGDPLAFEPLLKIVERTQALADKARQPTREQMIALLPRRNALMALGRLPELKAFALLKELARKKEEAAVTALGFARYTTAVDILLSLLKDKDSKMAAAQALSCRVRWRGPGVDKAVRPLQAAARADNTPDRQVLRDAAFLSISKAPGGAAVSRTEFWNHMRHAANIPEVQKFLVDAPDYSSPLFAGGTLKDVLAHVKKCPNLRSVILVDWPGLAEAGVKPSSKVVVNWRQLSRASLRPAGQGASAPPESNTIRASVPDVLWETLASVSKDDRPVTVAMLGNLLVVSTLDKLIRQGPRIAGIKQGQKDNRVLPIPSFKVSVAQLFQFLGEVSGLRVRVDWPALEKAGVGKNEEVDLSGDKRRTIRISDVAWAVLIEAGGLGKTMCELRDGRLIIGAVPVQDEATDLTPGSSRPTKARPNKMPTPRSPNPQPPVKPRPEDSSEQKAQRKLRLARTCAANKLTDKAGSILRSIIKDYPDTAAAKEARKELEALK